MSQYTEIDFMHFTSVRFRGGQSFDTILPILRETIEREYKAKGATKSPKMFLHNQLPEDTIIIENIIVPEVMLSQSYPRLYVDALCGVSVLRGSDIFASGVVGIETAAAKGSPVSVFACLDKFTAGFTKAYTGNCRYLGNGLLVMDRKQLLGDLHAHSGVAVQMTQPLAICPSFQSLLFQSGALVAQNLPSLVCARVLDAAPGHTVLDMCSAPGGKSLHLADIMRQKGTLIAVDKSAKRLQSVRDVAAKLGIVTADSDSFLRIFCFDSCRLCDLNGSDPVGSDSRPPFGPAKFDRLLLDAPCSALGQRPRLQPKLTATETHAGPSQHCSKSAKHLDSYAPLQRRLLQQAIQLVKPGGFLVYSTCTTRAQENEDQVLWALKTHWPRLRLAEQKPNLRPFPIEQPDGSVAMVQKFDSEINYQATMSSTGDDDFDSACNYDTIGFFVAKFAVQ